MDEKEYSSSPDATSPDEQQVTYSTYIKPQARLLHDPAVSFEEYQYYAQRTREEQRHLEAPKLIWREILTRSTVKNADKHDAIAVQKATEAKFVTKESRLLITDEEWTNASRAMRTASSGAAFYLITTDILGPYGVGFAMGTLGWGPGIVRPGLQPREPRY